jgi:hypothetical protein
MSANSVILGLFCWEYRCAYKDFTVISKVYIGAIEHITISGHAMDSVQEQVHDVHGLREKAYPLNLSPILPFAANS